MTSVPCWADYFLQKKFKSSAWHFWGCEIFQLRGWGTGWESFTSHSRARNSRDLVGDNFWPHLHFPIILAPGVLPPSPKCFLSRTFFHINNPACCHKIGYSKFQDIPSPSQTHKSGCWKEICSHSGWGFLGKLQRKSRPYVRS